MTTETLRTHYGEIGRAADGSLPGCEYRQDVIYDTGQFPDIDYLGALTCVNDALTTNMLEIPAASVFVAGSPGGYLPRGAIAVAVPPTAHYFIEARQLRFGGGGNDSWFGLYGRYFSATHSYLLRVTWNPGNAGFTVIDLCYVTISPELLTVIGTYSLPVQNGTSKLRWELVGRTHTIKWNNATVLTISNRKISSAGSVGLVINDNSVAGRDVKFSEARAGRLPFVATPCRQQVPIESLGEELGQHIAMNSAGDVCASGNFGSSTPGDRTVVQVYRKTNGIWANVATITPAVAGSRPGWALDMSDDLTIVAGGAADNEFFVYTYTGSDTWSEQIISTPGIGPMAISRDGGVIVTGDLGLNKAYFWKPVIGVWTLIYTYTGTAPGYPADYDEFDGFWLSPDGTHCVINNQYYNSSDNTNTSRAMLLYSAGLTTWSLVQTAIPQDFNAIDAHATYFSNGEQDVDGTIDMSGNMVIALAAPADDTPVDVGSAPTGDNANFRGRVYIFTGDRIGGFTQQCALYHSESVDPVVAGGALSIGTYLAITDDGDSVYLTAPEFDRYFWPGAVFAQSNVSAKTGFIDLSTDGDVFEIINPYIGSPNASRWGMSIACDALGENLCVGSDYLDGFIDFYDTSCIGSIASDQFAGTGLLTAHTSNSGNTWSVGNFWQGNITNALIVDGGFAKVDPALSTGNAFGEAIFNVVPPSADYSVVAYFDGNATATNDVYLGGRFTATNNAGDAEGYAVRWQDGDGSVTFNLQKVIAGSGTVIGSGTVTVGPSFIIELAMINTSIKVYVNNAQLISVTDSAVTQVGSAYFSLKGTTLVDADRPKFDFIFVNRL